MKSTVESADVPQHDVSGLPPEHLVESPRPRDGRPGWHWVLAVVAGAVAGAAAVLNALTDAVLALRADQWSPFAGPARVAMCLAAGAAAGVAAALAIDAGGRALLRPFSAGAAARFTRLDPLCHLPLLAVLAGAVGVRVPLPLVVMAVLAVKGLLLLAAVLPERRTAMTSMGWLAFLFLISGFAAMIYQVVWQRTLFAAFGVNIESITIVVSLFMFGLGLGSLVGGAFSRRFPDKAPWLFLFCELGIGLFGLASLPLITRVSEATLHGSLWTVSLAVLALLALPTMLMGATLPILVTHLHRHLKNVGQSVGLLYCINTLGSAVACFLTVDLLFLFLGQQASVGVAAGCNLLVGVLVWRYARQTAKDAERDKRQVTSDKSRDALAADDVHNDGETKQYGNPQNVPSRPGNETLVAGRLSLVAEPLSWARRAFVLFFAAAGGYISLSQEMLWMRIVSVMTGGRPSVFAHVLGFFLIGVAVGALWGERLCGRRFGQGQSPVRFIAGMLLVSGVFYYASIAGTAWVSRVNPAVGQMVMHLVVAMVSLLLGGLFPLLCHYGAQAGRSVGVAVSRVYVANIVGSTAGPLLTGFVLMEVFSTADIVLGLSVATVALGGLAWMFDRGWTKLAAAGVVAAAVVAMFTLHGRAYANLLEAFQGVPPFKFVSETRSGVAGVLADPDWPDGPDIMYGGGMYDGRFAVDPIVNSNIITRAYMIAGLHPAPKDVLEVGLSTGSWSRVLANYAPVERLTIVEINAGYLDLIRHYPEQGALRDDPRVNIVIDDGRRWLNRNPDARFDFILQNTTFHWRSQITGLISEEYLRLVKSRLKPGGVFYYNSTWSPEIPATAARVFKHVAMYNSFVAASDSPFEITPEQMYENLRQFSYNGVPTFDLDDPAHAARMTALADMSLEDQNLDGDDPARRACVQRRTRATLIDQADLWRARSDVRVITDDNMATEYKLVRWHMPQNTWAAYAKK